MFYHDDRVSNNAYWNDGYYDGKNGLSYNPPDWAGSQAQEDYDDGFAAGIDDRY
jgi:hypothetical protein